MFSVHALHDKRGMSACIVWLYYASSSTMWWCPDNFFFLLSSVWSPWKTKVFNLIRGGIGSTWGDDFYMDMQNGSKLGQGILIHALERPFEVFPCLYREAMHLQCFMRMRYVINGEYPSRTRTYYDDDLYHIWSKLEYTLHTTRLQAELGLISFLFFFFKD
jgi:hypothetical protein